MTAMHAELAADFHARLQRFVRRHVPTAADADDVTQDVMLRLWLHREAIEPEAAPAWLFQVARNAIADFHRARGRAPAPLADDLDVPEPPPAARRMLADCLLPMLAGLDAEDRQALERVDLADGAQTDLAAALGLSPSGARSRVQRARARLHRAVTDCCRVELDRRGLPLDDYECRHKDGCDC